MLGPWTAEGRSQAGEVACPRWDSVLGPGAAKAQETRGGPCLPAPCCSALSTCVLPRAGDAATLPERTDTSSASQGGLGTQGCQQKGIHGDAPAVVGHRTQLQERPATFYRKDAEARQCQVRRGHTQSHAAPLAPWQIRYVPTSHAPRFLLPTEGTHVF